MVWGKLDQIIQMDHSHHFNTPKHFENDMNNREGYLRDKGSTS